MTIDPVLIDVPEHLLTERLLIRPPQRGDGAKLNAAVVASIARLGVWMPWAQKAPTLDESEAYCRRQRAKFMLREDLTLLLVALDSLGGEGEIVGAGGLHRIDWTLRSFEIGYWIRDGFEGKGYVSEAVDAIAAMAFGTLAARRVEIRCDAGNARSARVAERCGFTLEGTLRQDSETPRGEPRDTRVYARVRS